ncbi:MAG: ferrous iron transport protein B [Balneolales bacterium]
MDQDSLSIALVGNPNTGKSTLFNALTGLNQKIANYPGVTVERKVGSSNIEGHRHKIIDLPGTYSLNHNKIDERITYQALIGEYKYESAPDLVLVVVDSSNLERNLYLATQVMDLNLPMIILLNMADIAEERGLHIDAEKIEGQFGVPVIPLIAKRAKDVEVAKAAIAAHDLSLPEPLRWKPDPPLEAAIDTVIEEWIKPYTNLPARSHIIEALRLISDNQLTDDLKQHPEKERVQQVIQRARTEIEKNGGNALAAEVLKRYDFIGTCTQDAATREPRGDTLTDKIDAVVTHKIFGPIIYVSILLLMFQSIFSWAEPFMNMIDWVFIETGNFIATQLPGGMLNDLVVEGIIAGLGGVIIFLPQIMFLFFFISILEGTGYMARAAFVMDGFMSRIGLHGKSVVPLMSGFACAIPGIMATRTIENYRDRLLTIMVLPFMACSARLPVYALMIAAFIPSERVLGIFSLQGITFFGLYFFGIVMAILVAFLVKRFSPSQAQTPFLMELPGYKMPKWSSVFYNMFDRGRIFVVQAGKIIMSISIILWFLASFPQQESSEQTTVSKASIEIQSVSGKEELSASEQIRQSYMGRLGRLIEPAIEPLGFDWKIGIGLITSFAAREVMVGTLNTIYSIESEDSNIATLQEKLVNDVHPETGKPVYTIPTAISLMIFFALAMQCMSTIAIVKRETNSLKWPAIMFVYMTSLAYICSFIAYQAGNMF